MKKALIFLPIILVALIFIALIYYSETLPKGPEFYIFILLNIIATLLIRKNEAISRIYGLVFVYRSLIYNFIFTYWFNFSVLSLQN